jgi:hypothetical protein
MKNYSKQNKQINNTNKFYVQPKLNKINMSKLNENKTK